MIYDTVTEKKTFTRVQSPGIGTAQGKDMDRIRYKDRDNGDGTDGRERHDAALLLLLAAQLLTPRRLKRRWPQAA